MSNKILQFPINRVRNSLVVKDGIITTAARIASIKQSLQRINELMSELKDISIGEQKPRGQRHDTEK